jgi:hypothetical protein
MMPRYNVMVEVQVEAVNDDEAWTDVAAMLAGINDLVRDMHRSNLGGGLYRSLLGYHVTENVELLEGD